MRLKSVSYSEFLGEPKEWSISDFTLEPINLVVGKNATGKTRTLNVLSGLGKLLSGRQKPSDVPYYEGLMNEGFSVIIGVRDVYPLLLSDLPKLRTGLCYQLKTKPVSVDFVLGVMEIEAWFLAEHTHFPRIHPKLAASRIAAMHGFDPSVDDMQLRTHPALDLHNAYSLEGFAYQKRGSQIERTVEALDYAEMYLEHKTKFPDFAVFMRVIDQFFS